MDEQARQFEKRGVVHRRPLLPLTTAKAAERTTEEVARDTAARLTQIARNSQKRARNG